MRGSRGFTLIELLVVVLIIGVLAAIALPQYQKAVLKSRYSGLMPITAAVANAQEIYYMDNGRYSTDITQLDIKAPSGGANAEIEVNDGEDTRFDYVLATRDDAPGVAYVMYQKRSEQFPDAIMCEANDELNPRATWLCHDSLKGEEVTSGSLLGDGWTAYLLKGVEGSSTFAGPSGCTGDAPTMTAGKTHATSTAECVNNQWQFVTWTGGDVYTSGLTTCTGNEAYECSGATFEGYNSQCEGKVAYACAGAIMVGSAAQCKAYAENACVGVVYSPGLSYATNGCVGEVANGCAGSVISGPRTYCSAAVANGCAGAIIQDGGNCGVSTLSGTCAGALIRDGGYCNGSGCDQAEYSGTGCCLSGCVAGQPKCQTHTVSLGYPPWEREEYDGGWDGETVW